MRSPAPSFARAVVAAVVVATTAVAAHAGIYLNGVNIDGVTGQTFENCTVTIDDKGNVLIVAKGYEVQGAPTKPATAVEPATPVEPVTKRYFLVSEQNIVGMAQYDIDVYVNSQWVKRIGAAEPQVVVEVSKYLHKGKNVVHFTATKNTKEPRKSTSPQHFVKVHIGDGNIGGNNVMLEGSLIEYVRTAAETLTFDDDVVLKGQ
jgi:hypothetical protein